jgi:DNA-binding response OmpR family regulator
MSERVLIVDDEASVRRLLTGQLSLAGFDPLAVEDGCTALELAATAAVDAVVLDVIMPAMDGFEVCRRLKANPQTAAIPIVFLSTTSSGEYRRRAFALGAADFLVKPFQTNVLPAHLRAILNRGSETGGMGRIVSVIGDTRAAGAAAEAVRLAEMAVLSEARPVMLIDLESPNGVIGARLQLAGGPNVHLLLQNTGEPVSNESIARVAQRYHHRLEVIPAPYTYAPLSQSEPQPQRWVDVLENLTGRGYLVVTHLGSKVDEIGLIALSRSEMVWIVTQDESAPEYRALLAAIAAGGVPDERLRAAGPSTWTTGATSLPPVAQQTTRVWGHSNETASGRLAVTI